MKLGFLTALALLFLNSCQERSDQTDALTNRGHKYWLLTENRDEGDKAIYFYYFDTNRKHLVFSKGYRTGIFAEVDSGDVVYPDEWELINDKIIRLNKNLYYIDIVDKNEIVLMSPCNGHLTRLISAPDSLIPKEYQKMQE